MLGTVKLNVIPRIENIWSDTDKMEKFGHVILENKGEKKHTQSFTRKSKTSTFLFYNETFQDLYRLSPTFPCFQMS